MSIVKHFAQSLFLLVIMTLALTLSAPVSAADPGAPDEDQHVLDSLGLLPSGVYGTEPTLQELLDIFVPGAVPEDALSVEDFCNPTLGAWEIELMAENSGLSETNALGYYASGDAESTVKVVPGSADPGFVESFRDPIVNPVGYYFARDPAINWYTELSLNYDERQHALIFGTADPNTYFIFWEDLIKLGDRDYNDMVIRATRVIDPPVVELPDDETILQCSFEERCFDLSAMYSGCIDDEITVEMIEGLGTFSPITAPSPIAATHCFIPQIGAQQFVFRVTDSEGNFGEDTLTLTFVQNQMPICAVESEPVVTLCEPETICFPVSCDDPDRNLASGPSIVSGPGEIIGDEWCYQPIQSEIVSVTLECIDECGEVCQSTFTVDFRLDEEPPIISCPANILIPNDLGQCGAVVQFQATIEDNCPGSTLECEPPSGSFFPVGVTTVTCTGTDAAGNTSECFFDITVEDTESPVIDDCPGDIVIDNDPGQCGAEYSPPDIIATDNCPGVTLYYDNPFGAFLPIGITPIRFTATDAAGNVTECEYIVTVEDTELPQIDCPPVIAVPTSPGECGAFLDAELDFTDNCPGATAIYDPPQGTLLPPGVNPVNCVVTDAAGNVAECLFPFIVDDHEPPILLPPPPFFEFGADPGLCGTTVEIEMFADDNCPGATAVCDLDGQFLEVGEHTATCHAVDAAGNTSPDVQVLISVVDRDDPVFTSCPNDRTVPNDPGECGAIVPYGVIVEDNCPDVTVDCEPPAHSFFPVGETTVTCTATDASGNTAVCEFTITVEDTEPPQFDEPGALLIVPNDPGVCGADVELPELHVTDNCPGVDILPQGVPSIFPIGTTVITYTAIDLAGNTAEFVLEVTVEDVEPPTLACPPNFVIEPDENCQAVLPEFDLQESDNCPGVTVSCDPPPGTVLTGAGTYPIACTAIDAGGNEATCTFDFIIEDNEPPVISCPIGITVDNDPEQCGAVVDFRLTSDDNCTLPEVMCDPESGSFFPIGETTVTCTASDGVNEAQCQFLVTVVDVEPPTIQCPEDIVVDLPPGETDAVVDFVIGSTDNCPGATVVASPASGSTFPIGTTTVHATATDASGNTSECDFIVTVNPPPCLEIDLCRNYTLFSFNVVPENNVLGIVLSPIDGLYTNVIGSYCGTGAATWADARPEYLNDLKTLDHLHGYWLIGENLDNATLEICGFPALPAETPLELCESWNLISYIPNEADALTHAWSSINGNYERAFGVDCELGIQTWSAERPDFLNDLVCLRPTHGYWVKMTEADVLTYPGDGYDCQIEEGPARISYTILDNVAVTPYFADVWSTTSSQTSGLVEGAVVQVYDSDGVLCGESYVRRDGAFLVHVTGDDPSTTIDEGASENDQLTFRAAQISLATESPVIWRNRESIEVSLEQSTARTTPAGFSLLQNFPNPFNAGTVIRFSIEQPSAWTVTIYNVMGQHVRSFEGVAETGMIDVSWDATAEDGTKVSSGIYFYTVKAGKKSGTRKMTLLR